MENKQYNTNTSNNGSQSNDNNKQHKTPRETKHDIDEMTARVDEYEKFNKNTVQPQPQLTPDK